MKTITLKEKLEKACEKIKEAEKILLVTHERPDGDGLSSVCALSILLTALEKNYDCFCASTIPAHLHFLPNIEKFSELKNFNFANYDLIIILDCGCLSRTKLTEQICQRNSNQTIIEFDHHPKVDDYADLEIRISGKSSTAEIIYYFFSANNIPITKEIADCLLTGIMTDTGNLVFSSVNEETIKISSTLLLSGGSLTKIIRQTSGNKSVGAMNVWGKILENLKINKKYNFAYSIMTLEEVEKFHSTSEDDSIFDSASDILNRIEGVKAVLFLREEAPGKIRGSLRTSDNNVDVSKIAAKFGGGGHAKAAAFRIDGHIVKTETGWKII